MEHIVIIGNGISGVTAARHIRKLSDKRISIISSETEHFVSRTALMYIYMGHMEFKHTQPYENWFWKKNRLQLIQDSVINLDPKSNQISLKSAGPLNYDKLILATGSTPVKLNIPGANLDRIQSLYSKQDLELMEQNTRDISSAVVIGGGLIGIEMAEMLHSRGIHVTMIIREKSFWNVILPPEESEIVTNHIKSRGIELILGETVERFDGNSQVESLTLSNGQIIKTDFAGITIGVRPNVDFLKGSGIEIDQGILVNEFLSTNFNNIYAIGDCAQLRTAEVNRKSTEPVWYTGRKMGEVVAQNIIGLGKKYEQGLWFNSAKFFDLEYQTYGYVPSIDDTTKSYYWEDVKKDRALRLVVNMAGNLVGINAIGLRIKHEISDAWLTDKLSFEEAIERIDELNFNPEFFGKLSKILDLNEIV